MPVAEHAGVGLQITFVLIAQDANDIAGPGVGAQPNWASSRLAGDDDKGKDRGLRQFADRVAQAWAT